MFTRLMRRDPLDTNIEKLYGAIVAQARAPAFYSAYGVPDTAAGRFDMIVLHVHLVVRRLVGEGAERPTAGRELCERFFSDMDANLRELGVGDLAVPRQMRDIAEAYYGRAKSYDAALQEKGEAALAAVLARNVFGKPEPVSAVSERLARYIHRLQTTLAAQPEDSIVRGEIAFPRPEDA
ncbi:MAG TPA: ubiquinol-cytochrome C chaperone family protein [Xanthobacteraceae bacterium]